MNRMLRAGLAALALTLAGCSVVYSPSPVGEELVKLDADEWNGAWVGDDGAIMIQVTNGDSGVIRLAGFDVSPSAPAPKPYTTIGYVRRSGNWMFGSMPDEERTGRFLWGRLAKNQGRIILWAPRPERFKALVEAGKLPGTVTGSGDVILGAIGPRELKLLMAEDGPTPFEWDEPIVLTRVGK